MNPTRNIIVNFSDLNRRLKVVTAHTHERQQSLMQNINVDFYAISKPGLTKPWCHHYNPFPKNYTDLGEINNLPIWLDIDCCLSQNKFAHFELLSNISRRLQVPLLTLEHCWPMPNWSPEQLKQLNSLRGYRNVFIAESQIAAWNVIPDETTRVIRHALDSHLFSPGNNERVNQILCVVNDYKNRGSILGFQDYLEITNGLPVRRIGDTPGFSKSAKDVNDLVNEYRTSTIFINTSIFSPIPMSLLEAMSCSCACLSYSACEVPYYIQDGFNGLLYNDIKEAKEKVRLLLNDSYLREILGSNARQTIIEKCNLERFTREWNEVFNEVIS